MKVCSALFPLLLSLSVSCIPCSAQTKVNVPLSQCAEETPMQELGRMLWFDPRLSRSGFISCNSCHNLSTGGVDNLKTSVGDYWQQGPSNSPTVLNAEHQVAQFWDGRASSLEEQAGGPITNPKEMGATHELAVTVIDSIPGYKPYFRKAFGTDEVTFDRITASIGAFEKTLVTPDYPFARYMKGDKNAISKQQIRGWETFKNYRCVTCHSGPNYGGKSFQKMGAVKDYETTNPSLGRADFTKRDRDRMFFKVPILLNIELTYPYFHDGAVSSLPEAVKIMGELQLERSFSPEQIADIAAWLKSLTGKQPEIVLPKLPPNGPLTPIADPWQKSN